MNYSVAQFGTFDINNYGDQLFPIILKYALTKRLNRVKIDLYSPLSTIVENQTINSIRPPFKKGYNALILGGGDIISYSLAINSIYDKEFKKSHTAHFDCWGVPMINADASTPIIWNAVGVPQVFYHPYSSLIQTLCSRVSYISVRDEISKKNMQHTGIAQPIELIPDTAVYLSKIFSCDYLREKIKHLVPENYFIFQISPYFFSQVSVQDWTRFIQDIETHLSSKCILLPICRCHGDDEALKQINGFEMIEKELSIEEIAGIIASARCFIGSSLHGAVTAYSYGIPFVSLNLKHALTKLSGFSQLINEPERNFAKLEDIENQFYLLEGYRKPSQLPQLLESIEKHFDRIAEIILKGETTPHISVNPDFFYNFLHIAAETIIQKKEIERLQKQMCELDIAYRDEFNKIYSSRTWKLASFLRSCKRVFSR